MKVYFTAATSFNGELHDVYKKIVLLIRQHRMELISGNQIVNKKVLQKDKQLSSKEIYEREQRHIASADLLIVEGSRPSLGVGSEINHALYLHKPVLVLVSDKYEDKISPIISGNPSETLFLQFYNNDNLKYKIGDFIKYVCATKKRKGKLIVIDGGDDSGKSIQATLLVSYLKMKNIPVRYVDFPQYYHSFHGKTVAKFLRGEFGNIDQVSPYLASLAYALDRATIKREMTDFLATGGYIIANRYATSNMAHQSAKLTDEKERKEFLKWVYELEYKVHRIPKENVVIYLHVPWQMSMKLTHSKADRKYLKGKKQDIAEADVNHRMQTEKMYLELAAKNKHWIKINCVTENKMRSIDDIHHEITTVLHI